MKFDVYGRFQIEVCREDHHWVAYRLGLGKRTRLDQLVIPEDIRTSHRIARYLDDLYHEAARPGHSVSVIED